MSPIKYKDLVTPSVRSGHKNIVFALPNFRAGGAERVLITFMNNLDRALFTPHLIVMNDEGTLREWVADDITVHSLGITNINRSIHKLAQLLSSIEPDIIFSTTEAMNIGILMAKPLLKKPAKIVVRETLSPSKSIEKRAFPWLVRNSYQRLYQRADLVLSPCRSIIDDFRDNLNIATDNHVLLYNPVSSEVIRNTQATLPMINDDRRHTIRFVCAGPLCEQKGFDRLIGWLSQYKTVYDWKLTILGEGPDKQQLEHLAQQSGLEKNVLIAGHTTRPWPIIAAADALLLPSRWEGLPNVVLESLALGTPVIAMQEDSGIHEIAHYAAAQDVKLADSMESFLHHMEKVQPNPTSNYRDSLLPANFDLKIVLERLTNLLLGHDFSAQDMPNIPAPVNQDGSEHKQSA